VPLGTQLEYVCELKIDGSALALTYEHGVLVRGATRVTGLQEKILLKMCEQSAQFPAIEFSPPIEVRGEAFTVAGVSTNQSGAGDRWGAIVCQPECGSWHTAATDPEL